MLTPVRHPLSGYSALLDHGFFGREGGTSSGVYSSLNVSRASGDCPENVSKNRAIVASAMHCTSNQICCVRQRHTSRVLHIDKHSRNKAQNTEADGMLTKDKGLLLLISTADCIPWIFFDPEVPLAGLIHVGWRGLLSGIIENTLYLAQELGALRERIVSIVGPCIRQPSYEVDQEYYDRFLQASNLYADHFLPIKKDAYLFDLSGAFRAKLLRQNVKSCHDLQIDTYTQDAFFSHRRAKHHQQEGFGCQASTVMLR